MQILDYLYKYQNISFKELPFNEIDALLLSLVAYSPFDEIKLTKSKTKSKKLYELISSFDVRNETSERKLKYLELTKAICRSSRFQKAKFCYFRKRRDTNFAKQFQAITIVVKQFAFVAFCGTDSTTLGWKEDFDMAYLDVVPSEIEAINYLNEVARHFLFKKIYLGGHSKGGRLAISAAKGMKKKRKLLGVYAFDAPNYPMSFYDETYKEIDYLIHPYAPEESIIGRLMPSFKKKRIISSTNKLLMQHDAFSWLVSECSFVYKSKYTDRSTHIVDTVNYALNNYEEEGKRDFINTIFDLLYRLNIEKLPNEKEFIPYFINNISSIKEEWNNTSKEKRALVKKTLFDLAKDYLLKKRD